MTKVARPPNTMSLAEALTKARDYDKKHEGIPSVSRTLADEVERLLDRCAELEANLTIAERQVTEARMELDRRSSETVSAQEPTCAICGEHANEHLTIPHVFMSGGRATPKAKERSPEQEEAMWRAHAERMMGR